MNTLVAALLLAFAGAPTVADLDPKRVRYIAHNEATGNFVFRGNIPQTNGLFAWDLLNETMRTAALASAGVQLPLDYVLLDLSLLDALEFKDAKVEIDFFAQNPHLGQYVNWPLIGDFREPDNQNAATREQLARTLSAWQLDNLPDKANQLKMWLEMPNPNHSVDRTGELSGAFYMSYLNWTFSQALVYDVAVEPRNISIESQNAFQWFCYYLKYTLQPALDCGVPANATNTAHQALVGYVHAHARGARRLSAWQRTKCGSPAVGAAKQADLITEWGGTVTPSNVLPEYPRPQMTRPNWVNLNGLWEFALARGFDDAVPFGVTLNGTILVPFPLESCLSGAFSWPAYSQFLFYRLLFDAPSTSPGETVLLHFGAVDWNATVYVNGQALTTHIGGYDGFSLDLSSVIVAHNNELIVQVFDPSDTGAQPNGKQRFSAINSPGGDTYTPSSGIWQTVWLEVVPAAMYVAKLKLRGDLTSVHVTCFTEPADVPALVTVTASLDGVVVGTVVGPNFVELVVPISNPQLWTPDKPTLYNLTVTAVEPSTGTADTVDAYTALRVVSLLPYTQPPTPASGPRVGWDNAGGDLAGMPLTLNNTQDYHDCWALCNATAACVAWSYGVPGGAGACNEARLCWLKGTVMQWAQNPCRVAGTQASTPAEAGMRPAINNEFTFLAGWLDQSWWPDGEYTAPTDAALASDLLVTKTFGFNTIRLHQKINSERWYYHADRLGVVVLQDMVQKYGGATQATVPLWLADAKSAIDGRYNHPCIIQWDIFNEGDCVGAFSNVSAVIAWARSYDPSRLVDTNSGGPANDLHIGDVNDVHNYPYPGAPLPSATQYAMQGEFGGIGAFTQGHEWAPNQCSTYLPAASAQDEANLFIDMVGQLLATKSHLSCSIYTQVTDVENECDGFLNMDRTNKFNTSQIAAIFAANQNLINSPADGGAQLT